MKRYVTPPRRPPKVYLGNIPKGFLGTQRTVEHMKELIRQGAKDFYVRQKAIDILLAKGVKPKDYLGEIRALFEWVQKNVRYTKDPFRVEVLHSARRLLELRAGDCDDMTIVLSAMLESIGHPVRLVLVGRDPRQPLLFTHVYLEVFHHGRWIPLDPTMPHPMGWAPETAVKKVIPIERRPAGVSQKIRLHGIESAATKSGSLAELIDALGGAGLGPKDPRVKTLWHALRRNGFLDKSPWLRALLGRAWAAGLPARPRPRTRRRLLRQLRLWGLWSPSNGRAKMSLRPVRRVALRRVRPVAVRRAPVPSDSRPKKKRHHSEAG